LRQGRRPARGAEQASRRPTSTRYLIPALAQAAAYCEVQMSDGFQKPSAMTVDSMLSTVTATGGLRNAGCPSTVPFDGGVFPLAYSTAACAAFVASSLKALYVVMSCRPPM